MDELALKWNMQIQKSIHTNPPLPPFTQETAVTKARLADDGLMRLRLANINDLPIKESERKYRWPLGRRPDDHPGLSDICALIL